MINNEPKENTENVCDISYLTEMMGGKKQLIKEIMDVFLEQIPEEIQHINEAVIKTDYPMIKKFAHSLKSSVSIMGISVLTPILRELEDLGTKAIDIEKIKELNITLNLICNQAIEEIENVKHNYI